MKKIAQIQAGEEIQHTGDLTVEGNIGKNAKIALKDGSLIVNGNVESGAVITVKASEDFRNQSTVSSLISMFPNAHILGSSSVHIRSGLVVNSVSANMNMSVDGVEMYIGNVNINNRILTDGAVRECGNDTYEIIAAPGTDMFSIFEARSQAPSKPVTATIDGRSYTGLVIRVEGKTVKVDGHIQTATQSASSSSASSSSAAAEAETPLSPAKLCVKGMIQDGVTIRSDVAIEVAQIGLGCTIISEHEGITAKNVGHNTRISVRDAINVQNVGKGVNLSSAMDGLSAQSIGDRSIISVRDEIEVSDIGDSCELRSEMDGIKAANVGVQTQIHVRDAVNVQNVGAYSQITSKTDGIKARNIADRVHIDVRDHVRLKSLGAHCVVSSTTDKIEVENLVGAQSRLQARDGIIAGVLEDQAKLSCKMGIVQVLGKSGNDIVIEAHDGVRLKEVGNGANLSSSMGEVSTQNIGINAVINARDGIDIDGTCPDPTSLSLNVKSRSATIQRPTRAAAVSHSASAAAPVLKKEESSHIMTIHNEDEDLNTAIALSLSQEPAKASSAGLFAPKPVVDEKAEAEEIPDFMLCPINMTLMDKPMFCSLDGRTYEKATIHAWLTEHRFAPANREPLAEGQTVNSVLSENFDIKSRISEWKTKHPAVSKNSELKM